MGLIDRLKDRSQGIAAAAGAASRAAQAVAASKGAARDPRAHLPGSRPSSPAAALTGW